MGEANARGRAVEIRYLTLEPDGAGLALAHAKVLARRLALELNQWVGGRVGEPGHAIGPAEVDEVALDRRHRPRFVAAGIDTGERADPRCDVYCLFMQAALHPDLRSIGC